MFAFFVLGREPRLSIAEIAAVYGSRITSYPFISEQLLIAELPDFDAQEAADRLGGSVKYGTAEKFEGGSDEDLKQLIANRVVEENKRHEREGERVTFSVSGYNHFSGKPFGFEIKSLLQKEGYSVRLATSKEETMSAAAVHQAKLLIKGADIVISRDGKSTWFGITKAVQPFEAQSHRDYDRPARDQYRGMIPVQLARTLVNIALGESRIMNNESGITLLDPFCGEGTILMEAALLGVKNVIGADIDEMAIKDSKVNLEWLMKSPTGDTNPLRSTLYAQKFPELHTRDAKLTPQMPRLDAVVTEPYLGEPVMKPLAQGDVAQRHKELGKLYAECIRPIANALKKDALLIMTLPAYKLGNKFVEFPKQGLLPVSLEAIGLPGPGTHLENVIYKRADQFIGREILIAKKK